MDIEDSDEEQDLQGLQTNIFNKISSSSIETLTILTSPKPKQPEQPIADQITKQTVRPVVVEQDTSIPAEQIRSSSAEQVMPPVEDAMPPALVEDLPSMPPTSHDEGYDHGVSINCMIVTPRVPTLGEQLPNVGTSTDAEPSEILQSNNKFDIFNQVVSMVVSMKSSIENELEDQALECAYLITVAEDRQ